LKSERLSSIGGVLLEEGGLEASHLARLRAMNKASGSYQ
jgi:hypothetical protein